MKREKLIKSKAYWACMFNSIKYRLENTDTELLNELKYIKSRIERSINALEKKDSD